MQQGDYSSAPYYHHHYGTMSSNPTPTDHGSVSYASAPPFSDSGYSPADYATSYPSNYPPYPQNSDSAPSYASHPNPSPNLPPPTNLNPSMSQTPTPAPPPPAPSSFPGFESHGAYQPPPQLPPQSYYSPPANSYDQPLPNQQAPPSYSAPMSAPPSLNSNPMPSSSSPPYSSMYTSSAPYGPPSYESSHHNSSKLDHPNSYFDHAYGDYGRSSSSLASELYGKQSDPSLYNSAQDDSYGDGVYAYQGGKVEPYGARGTAPKSSTWASFDDYGRPISFPSSEQSSSVGSSKIVRAVPKVEAQEDATSSVQKFRVKLLPETGSQSTMDVLCQIGLDGIKMLDPSTSRMLRIYPLENITRCEVTDSSTFAFWSKSSVDIEPRRIRLQSNRYTTNTILDIVTAATVQLKEMGGSRPSDTSKINEQPAEKKKGFGDWMNLIKPGNEEKDHWVPDEAVRKCTSCGTEFGAFVRRHHCRNCGDIFCDKCTQGRIALTADDNAQPVRVCDRCLAEVTHRLSNAKEVANKPVGLHSHADLAKKLQEEMEKNCRGSSSSNKSEGSGRRMREVECPTCTVHLQVQVPSSGSETIECGVCQHPFLVSAH